MNESLNDRKMERDTAPTEPDRSDYDDYDSRPISRGEWDRKVELACREHAEVMADTALHALSLGKDLYVEVGDSGDGIENLEPIKADDNQDLARETIIDVLSRYLADTVPELLDRDFDDDGLIDQKNLPDLAEAFLMDEYDVMFYSIF